MPMVFFITFLFSNILLAAVQLPQNLNNDERKEFNKIIGIATSHKLLSNPYPLGGYSGFEVGVSLESINTQELSQMGNKTPIESNLTYPRLTIGKGIYNDIDLYGYFIPHLPEIGLSEFGGMGKVCFYQAPFLPVTLSVAGYGGYLNLQNSFFRSSMGADFITGVHVSPASIYFGGGYVFSNAKFHSSITQSGQNEYDNASSFHGFFGIAFEVEPVFLAIQLDQYTQTIYGAKLGARF